MSINKTLFKSTDAVIYNIRYIRIKSLEHINIDSESPLCIIFNDVDAYIIEENNGYKYLIFACTNKNKKVLRKYTDVLEWN